MAMSSSIAFQRILRSKGMPRPLSQLFGIILAALFCNLRKWFFSVAQPHTEQQEQNEVLEFLRIASFKL